jgi:hypothetical protein
MLLNLSNHPSGNWPDSQLNEAYKLYGDIQDMPFPQIDPMMDEKAVKDLAYEYMQNILAIKPKAVHLMGELTFTFSLVNMLLQDGVNVIASTTHRIVEERDGIKMTKFEFIRFRSYKP